MNEILYNIKVRVKKIIDGKGFSIYKVAELSGVSDTCIRNWYSKNDYEPTLDSLIKVCNALNISLSEIFLNENEEMHPLTPDKKQLLDLWLLLTKEQQEHLLAFIKSIITNVKN